LPAKGQKSWVYWIGVVIAAIGLVALVNGLIHLLVGQMMGAQMMQGSMMGQGGMPPGTQAPMMPYLGFHWLRAVDRIVFGIIFLGVGAYMASEGKKAK